VGCAAVCSKGVNTGGSGLSAAAWRLLEYSFIHSFIYSPNAIKTKHNKITQLGMTTRQRICTYRSHKIIIK